MGPEGARAVAPVCRVCGQAAGFERVLKQLDRCCACGFVTWLGDTTKVGDLYADAYFGGGGDYPDYLGQQDSVRRSMRRHLEQMARYRKLEGSLLEVGCAYGLFLDEARNHFQYVAGVDICEEPVRYAKEELGLDTRVGDFLTVDFDGRRFDTVCLWDTLEHLPAPDRFLTRAAELLSPDGMLFATTADIGSWNARLRGAAWRHIHPPTHLHYFSRATISRLLDRVGFEVIGFETAAYYHTVYNILATLRMKRGITGRVAGTMLAAMGEKAARRLGSWIDLRDIMFIAARRH